MTQWPTIKTPAQIAPFAAVLGVDLTVAFILEFGGAKLELSRNATEASRLAQLVGVEKAKELAVACEGLPARIPTSKPWIACTLRSKGLPVSEIARKLHMSDVAVRRWHRNAGIEAPATNSKQLPLF